jgi:glucose dehydrogenase
MKGFVITAALAALPAAWGQSGADWPLYNRDLAGTRYSPLTQINTSNVQNLKQAWTYRLMPPGGIPEPLSPTELFQEVTPIVVNGVMYLPSANRVVALEPETGKEIWSYALPAGAVASQRGVAYWPGDKNNPPRILFTTSNKMVGLNAKTGRPDPGFGNEGILDMGVAFVGVPTIYKNVILTGANAMGPGEKHIDPQSEVPLWPDRKKGDSRAYDARTGKLLWAFHTVPQPGEPGHDTWQGDSWKDRGGNNMWAVTMTVDEKRGIAYMPIGGPAANYWGGDRKGNNLFANALVAVEIETGKLKWYFQTVHHELWDYDLPPEPLLLDIVKDGKKIPAVAQTGKSGYMYILDRVTGKPVFGVEEKPAPKGNVPDEWYSPTQPIPVKPPPLARVEFKPEDLVTAADTTAQHAAACAELVQKFGIYNDGPFTPWPYHEEGGPMKTLVAFPGFTGGVNWGGTAADTKLGYIFLNTKDQAGAGWIQKNPKAGEPGQEPYDRSTPKGLSGFSAVAKDENGKTLGNWPCQKPPWARLVAVNANTGDIVWQTPLGLNESLPEGKRNAGAAGSAGPIATAGGLVFIGATSDNRIRAFESKSGKELWSAKLDYTATAVPLTWQGRNGKQYVGIVAASGGTRDTPKNTQSLVVFSLP